LESPVTQRIRELILDGSLPAGSRVAEAAIAERLGVSRTPVRNALPALATEGLLEPAGKRGFAVRGFTVEDSFRATEMRCLLEGYAAREIAARGPSEELIAELRACLAEGDRIFEGGELAEDAPYHYSLMNQRFHRLIVEASDNHLLTDLIHRVYAVPFAAPGVVAFNNAEREEVFAILSSGQHHHHAIVDAIEARQPDLAEALMRAHSSVARRSLGVQRVNGSKPSDQAGM
jgi:GntR family transcriptional regulator of vanillate catabolism